MSWLVCARQWLTCRPCPQSEGEAAEERPLQVTVTPRTQDGHSHVSLDMSLATVYPPPFCQHEELSLSAPVVSACNLCEHGRLSLRA